MLDFRMILSTMSLCSNVLYHSEDLISLVHLVFAMAMLSIGFNSDSGRFEFEFAD